MPLMGLTAIELLIGRILLLDFKTPEYPKVEVVVGEWNEGSTLVRTRRPRLASHGVA